MKNTFKRIVVVDCVLNVKPSLYSSDLEAIVEYFAMRHPLAIKGINWCGLHSSRAREVRKAWHSMSYNAQCIANDVERHVDFLMPRA